MCIMELPTQDLSTLLGKTISILLIATITSSSQKKFYAFHTMCNVHDINFLY